MMYLTPRALAEMLSIHVNTVKRIPASELPFCAISTRGDRRYRLADVEAYLEARMVQVIACLAGCGCAGGQPASTCNFAPSCPRCGGAAAVTTRDSPERWPELPTVNLSTDTRDTPEAACPTCGGAVTATEPYRTDMPGVLDSRNVRRYAPFTRDTPEPLVDLVREIRLAPSFDEALAITDGWTLVPLTEWQCAVSERDEAQMEFSDAMIALRKAEAEIALAPAVSEPTINEYGRAACICGVSVLPENWANHLQSQQRGPHAAPAPSEPEEPWDPHAVDDQHPCFICGRVTSHDHPTVEWNAALAARKPQEDQS